MSTEKSELDLPDLASKRRTVWWTIFAIIVFGGVLVTGTGYRHGLPYIDEPDEMTLWTLGRATIDPTWSMFQPEQPPGMIFVSALVQRAQIALGNPFYDPAGEDAILRLLAIVVYTVSLIVVMLLSYRLAGPIAAAAAGLCWVALPLVDSRVKVATIDPWVTTWFILSIAAGIEGWKRKSLRWIGLSFVLAIFATLFKWQAAAALGMAGLALFTFWKSDRRKMLVTLGLYLIVVLAFSYWVIFVHHALEGGVYLPGTKTAFPTPTILLINLWVQFTQIGPISIFAILPFVGLLLSVTIPSARYNLHGQFGLWTFLPIIVAWDGILSFNGAPVYTRHYLGIMALLSVLAGVGVALVWQTLRKFLRSPRTSLGSQSLRLITALCMVVFGIIVAADWVAMLSEDIALNADSSKPDRRAIFADWANTTANDGPLLISDPLVAAAVQTLYGYSGRPIETPYNEGTSIFLPLDKITRELIIAKNIRYLIVPPFFDPSIIGVPLTHLISYDVSPQLRGSEWAAYYVGHIAQLPPEKVVAFGDDVRLNGYSLSKQEACPGDAIHLQLLWSAVKPPSRYYSFFLHMASDKSGELSMPFNGQEPVSSSRPTISWTRPDELLVSPDFSWSLPANLAPGKYALWLGVFEPLSGSYLLLPDGKHYDVLATINVSNCSSQSQIF